MIRVYFVSHLFIFCLWHFFLLYSTSLAMLACCNFESRMNAVRMCMCVRHGDLSAPEFFDIAYSIRSLRPQSSDFVSFEPTQLYYLIYSKRDGDGRPIFEIKLKKKSKTFFVRLAFLSYRMRARL